MRLYVDNINVLGLIFFIYWVFNLKKMYIICLYEIMNWNCCVVISKDLEWFLIIYRCEVLIFIIYWIILYICILKFS